MNTGLLLERLRALDEQKREVRGGFLSEYGRQRYQRVLSEIDEVEKQIEQVVEGLLGKELKNVYDEIKDESAYEQYRSW